MFLSIPDEDDQTAGAGTSSRAHAVVEVIDLSTRELLARKRFNEPLSPIKGGGAFSIVEDAVGNLRIQVWDLVLSTP